MADQIKSKQIFDPKLFVKQAQDALELEKILNLMNDSLKSIAKNSTKAFKGLSLENSKDVKEAVDLIQKSAKAVSNLEKFEKKRLQTLEKLDEANSDRVQSLAEVQVQLQLQNKANKDLVNQNAKIVGSYKAQSTRLNKLRKEYKDLRTEQGKETKETEELRKEITKLDKELKDVDASVGQFNREVGNYGEGVDDAIDATKEWALTLVGVAAAIEGVNTTIENSEEGSEGMASLMAQISAAASVTTNSIFDTASGLFTLAGALFDQGIPVEEAEAAYAKLTGSFDNFGKRIKTAREAADEATKSNFELEKSSRGLLEAVARLNGEIEKQNIIAGDSTRSFDEISAAANRATVLQIQRAKILRDIAREELRIIETRISALGESANSLALENEQSEKKIELIELQNELDAATLDNQKILRETTRDRFEQELDFAIDFFDSQKTLLERQIADEDQSFETRAGNLKRLQILAESSFDSQVELINAQVGQDIGLRELIKLDDEIIVRKKLISDFTITDETTLKRILDALRERKTVTQDVADAEKEINTFLAESVKETETLVNQLDQVLKEGQIAGTEDFDQNLALRRVKLEDQADFEIHLAEENADEIALIRAQLNNDLAALDREELENEKKLAEAKEDIRKKEKDEAIALANEIADATIEALDKQSEARLERLDAEISRREDSIARMSAKSEGEITEGIAFEEAQLEKARLKQQQEEEKAAKRQRLILVAQTFLNQLANSEEEGASAIAKALATAIGGEVIAETIAGSAFDGTEDTGEGNGMDAKNGKLWMVHPNERIMSKDQNNKVGSMTNEDLASLAYDYQNGSLENRWAFMPKAAGLSSEEKGATIIRESNDEVIQAIKDNKVSLKYEWNSLNEAIETQITGVKKTITKHKFESLKRIN